MSNKLITQTWSDSDRNLREGRLLVLLRMADYASDDGSCWPSLTQLAEQVRLSERQVRRTIDWLIDNGHLEITRPANGRSRPTQYRVLIKADVGDKDGDSNVTKRGTSKPKGGHLTPEKVDIPHEGNPYIEPSIEPLVEPSGAAAPHPTHLPAVLLFREFMRRWPNRTQREWIELHVTDIERWRSTLAEWTLRGWSPVNVKGMVEFYESNGGGGKPAAQDKNAEVFREYERKLREQGLWNDSSE